MALKEEKNREEALRDLDSQARFFKALGHPTRLIMLKLIRLKPRHGEELAAILKLKPATISYHLTQLSEAGLLKAQKSQYYQIYSLRPELLERRLVDLVDLPKAEIPETLETDAYRKKVIETFFEYGRLKLIPAQLKKRQVVLDVIVEAFEPGREYTEMEVNRALLEFNEDVAALRRELVAEKLMERSAGVYRRCEAQVQTGKA